MLHNIDQIISTTIPTIHVFNTYLNGGDALLLYFRYVEQGRLQRTPITQSNSVFMQNAMGWSKERLRKAKKVLLDNGFIEDVQEKDEKGLVVKCYIKVNFLTKSQVIHQSGLPAGGTIHPVENSPQSNNIINNIYNNNKYIYNNITYNKETGAEFVYTHYFNKLTQDKKKYVLKSQTVMYLQKLLSYYSIEQLINSAKNYFLKTEAKYIIAPQYFYSDTKQ